MSFLKTIQMFVANNPGLTNKEIAAALPRYELHSVQRAVCRLVMLGRATRKGGYRNYRYFAQPPEGPVAEVVPRLRVERVKSVPAENQEPAVNPVVVEMMQKAQELSDKGLYQRAATVLMEAFNRSKNEEVREKILIERQRCLSRVQKVKAPSDVWALAGNYARNA